jgi:peroxiredoxin
MEQRLIDTAYRTFPAAGLHTRDGLRRAQPAPDFCLPVAGGQHLRLSDLRGRRVILAFCATWGRLSRAREESGAFLPVRTAKPFSTLSALARLARERGVVVLAVFCGEPVHVVADFAAGHGIAFPALCDLGGEVKRRYGVTCLPTTFIIDEQGRMVHMHRGEMDDGALAPTDRLID